MNPDEATLQPEHAVERRQHRGHESPQVGQDHPDVVAAAAQDGVKRVAQRALQGATGEATVGLHVADHRLDRAASAQVALERRGQPASRACDVDRRGRHAVTAVAAIHESALRARVGQDLHLLQRLTQRVPVIGVPGHRPHADDEALLVGRRHRHLGPELVAHPRLAFGDAVHFRLVQRVELALVLRLLAQQPVHEGNLHLDPLPQGRVRDAGQLALDVAHHTARIALQPPQGLAHPLELPGMGIASDLARQPRRQPGVALAQRQARRLRQRHHAPARLFVEPRRSDGRSTSP